MNGVLGNLSYNGYSIYSDPYLKKTVVAKWCRSKKKRIRKKWKKMCFRTRRYLKEVPNLSEMIVMGNVMVCHPIVYEKIKES